MMAQIFGLLLILFGCSNRDTSVDKTKLLGWDYRLFQNTPAWTLAKAVEDGNIDKIKEEVSKDKSLLSFREPRLGQPILMLAVANKNFISVKTLLELGADPDMQDTWEGTSALMIAADIGGGGFIHPDADPRFLKILIAHGADVNEAQKGPRVHGNQIRKTPLEVACSAGNLDYVKILIDAGANVNYVNEYGMTSLYAAIISENPDVVMYLLQKGADFKRPMAKAVDGRNISVLDAIDWNFPSNSEEYKKKIQILNFLHEHGIKK